MIRLMIHNGTPPKDNRECGKEFDADGFIFIESCSKKRGVLGIILKGGEENDA